MSERTRSPRWRQRDVTPPRRRRCGCERVYALARESCGSFVSVVSAQVQGVDKMLAVLENALEQYNESNAVMDLVLFEDAMKHIARISRIVRSRRPVV